MGLATTHAAWTGGYRAFNEWRDTIACLAGFTRHIRETPTEQEAQGNWPEPPPDPLTVLMFHHDTTGVINPGDAGQLARRLEEILSQKGPFRITIPTGWTLEEIIRTTRQFQEGLERAAAAGEQLEFH